LGIENLNSNEALITVYPNPTIGELNIQNNSTQLFQFSLYNTLGETIISKSLTNKTSRIDLSDYSDGIYFYKICFESGKTENGKVIKQ